MPNDDQYVEIPFPARGLEISRGFFIQRDLTSADGLNVRTYEPRTDRARGGSRLGLGVFDPGQLPSGTHLVQHLDIVVDPDASALLDAGIIVIPPGNGADQVVINVSVSDIPSGIRDDGAATPPGNELLTPVIGWASIDPIGYGTPLSATQLNATAKDPNTSATVPGQYDYDPTEGTILDAGTHSLAVLFSPTDDKTYRQATGSNSIQVTLTTPLIDWPTPADITVGTALSSTQLNAVGKDPTTLVTLAGVHTYTPPSGTVLSVGNKQTLSDVFDATNPSYKNATQSVYINVVPASAGTKFVQSKASYYFFDNNATGTHTITFNNAVAGGNLIVIAVEYGDFGGGTLITKQSPVLGLTDLTDNLDVPVSIASSSHNLILQIQGNECAAGGTENQKLYYIQNASAGSHTITMTTGTPGDGYLAITIAEFSGVSTTGALLNSYTHPADVENKHTMPSITINKVGDLAVVYFAGGGNPDCSQYKLETGDTPAGVFGGVSSPFQVAQLINQPSFFYGFFHAANLQASVLPVVTISNGATRLGSGVAALFKKA